MSSLPAYPLLDCLATCRLRFRHTCWSCVPCRHTCFRVAVDLGDACILAFRELLCRCRFCLTHCRTECTNKDAGPWKRVVMTCTAAAAVSKTRGQRTAISMQRQSLAKLVQPGEVLALESADDAEGFSFWLAHAEGAVYTHIGPKETKNGRTFITGGLYIPVRYYSRSPPDSDTTFNSSQVENENVEGLLARNVSVTAPTVRRSARVCALCMLAIPCSKLCF